MACYSPWFKSAGGQTRQISCGQCLGCKLEYSRQYAVRCMHEAKLYSENCFITLTYKDAPLSLSKRDCQLFLKRLRERFPGSRIRYYLGGEYAPETRRPHYHACLFNFNFPDRVYFKRSGEFKLYTSELLASVWTHGFSTVADFSFETAAYCSRYVVDKVSCPDAPNFYENINLETGEVTQIEREFSLMSRRRGLGFGWINTFSGDVSGDGKVVVNGREVRAPRYYDKVIKDLDDVKAFKIGKARQAVLSEKYIFDNDNARLEAKRAVARAKGALFKRKLT